jgi:hypothetical protein
MVREKTTVDVVELSTFDDEVEVSVPAPPQLLANRATTATNPVVRITCFITHRTVASGALGMSRSFLKRTNLCPM